MKKLSREIIEKIKELGKKPRLRQIDIAKEAQVSQYTVSRYLGRSRRQYNEQLKETLPQQDPPENDFTKALDQRQDPRPLKRRRKPRPRIKPSGS